MRPTFVFKDPSSQTGSCPAFYDLDDGDAVIVGEMLDASDLAAVEAEGLANDSGIAPSETAVRIPAALVRLIRGAS